MPEKKQDCVLLLPAAGQGLRMGGPKKKPYLLLAGRPVIVHTLQACLKARVFSRLAVIVAPDEEKIFAEEIFLPYFKDTLPVQIVPGGKTRQDSVFYGLKALKSFVEEETIVCVHDAVRPLVTPSLLQRVIDAARLYGAAIAAVPVVDTVKEVDQAGNVLVTLPRERLVAVQTPQCFRYSLLWQAHCRAGAEPASDDASLVERLGLTVRVVPGSYQNIKLTTPTDLLLAEQYLANPEGGDTG